MASYSDLQRRRRRASRGFDAVNLATAALAALLLASCGGTDGPGGGPGGTPEQGGPQALQNTPPRSLGYLTGSCYAVSVVNFDALLSSDLFRQSDNAESTLGQITFGQSDVIRADFGLEVGVDNLWIAGVNVPWISRWTEVRTERHPATVHLLDRPLQRPGKRPSLQRAGRKEPRQLHQGPL